MELAIGTDLADHHGHLNVLSVLLAGLASLPLVARRSAPVWVFVVTALASAVLMGVGQPVGPPVGPTLALYWLAAAGTQRARLTLPLAGVLLVAHAAASGLATENFPSVELGFGALVWGGAWLVGDRTRMRRERLAELEARALRAEREAERERRLAAAEERARIARDLHDSAGHATTSSSSTPAWGGCASTRMRTARARSSRSSSRSRARPWARSTNWSAPYARRPARGSATRLSRPLA
ncbi:MAG TPA: histidine kinase [Solirubrobacteraceae bacterium]|nr:histidine kinase [Solirubrobacteraceae bacterium]